MKYFQYLIFALFVGFLNHCTSDNHRFSSFLKKSQQLSPSERIEQIEKFIATNDFPLIEDSTVYFLLEDSTAQQVFLAGDLTNWRPDSIALQKIPETDFWYVALTLPKKARIEYKFVCGEQWLLDPLNPLKDGGSYGPNSVLVMPDYQFPQEVLFKPEFRTSRLDTFVFKSRLLKNKRRVYFYHHLKAGANSPLILFQDGGDYLTFGKARIILDNLIGSGQLEPVVALFVEPRHRNREYWFNDAYLKMIFNELLPFVKKKYGLKNNRLAVGGASLGGLISVYALKNYGPKINFVFSQSGAFAIDHQRILKEVSRFPELKSFLYFSYGSFENLEAIHRKLKQQLEEKKINFIMKKYFEGHNWGNWRAHLKEALLLFAGGRKK